MQAGKAIGFGGSSEQGGLKALDIFDIVKFQDDIAPYNFALRAFGALLEGADLSHKFGDEWDGAKDYRYGLGVFIDMYLEKQDQVISALDERFRGTPEYQIQRAHGVFVNIQNGMLGCSPEALEAVNNTIKDLDRVIAEFGAEAYPQVTDIKSKLAGLGEHIYSRIENGK